MQTCGEHLPSRPMKKLAKPKLKSGTWAIPYRYRRLPSLSILPIFSSYFSRLFPYLVHHFLFFSDFVDNFFTFFQIFSQHFPWLPDDFPAFFPIFTPLFSHPATQFSSRFTPCRYMAKMECDREEVAFISVAPTSVEILGELPSDYVT